MYIFGVDIPLVELILGIIVVSAIILLEITAILILITYHMKNSKRLENFPPQIVGFFVIVYLY